MLAMLYHCIHGGRYMENQQNKEKGNNTVLKTSIVLALRL